MACAYVLYKPDCELLGHPHEMDGSIVCALQEPLTAHQQELLRLEFERIGCRDCNRCRGGDGDNPLSLWIETETELRKDLQRMVRLKAEYRARRWPDRAKRLRKEVRALVQEVLLIRNCDNAGSTPPTAKPEHSKGIGGAGPEINELESKTPPLDRNSGRWVNNKRAANLDGIATRTLADYRTQGIKNADRTLGRDRDGRVWRREGTPRSHPWYLRSTLRAK